VVAVEPSAAAPTRSDRPALFTDWDIPSGAPRRRARQPARTAKVPSCFQHGCGSNVRATLCVPGSILMSGSAPGANATRLPHRTGSGVNTIGFETGNQTDRPGRVVGGSPGSRGIVIVGLPCRPSGAANASELPPSRALRRPALLQVEQNHDFEMIVGAVVDPSLLGHLTHAVYVRPTERMSERPRTRGRRR
jgi:hypothetical protein